MPAPNRSRSYSFEIPKKKLNDSTSTPIRTTSTPSNNGSNRRSSRIAYSSPAVTASGKTVSPNVSSNTPKRLVVQGNSRQVKKNTPVESSSTAATTSTVVSSSSNKCSNSKAKDVRKSPRSRQGSSSSIRNYIWNESVEKLVSFYFSLYPFFENKEQSDSYLLISDEKNDIESTNIVDESKIANEMATVFVKTIFPFLERRINEEGVWRKSGNLTRIKKLQKELSLLIGIKYKEPPTNHIKKKNKSSASIKSMMSNKSLNASCNSLDGIDDDDYDYSVHDFTVVIKRLLIPTLLESPSVVAFFRLVDFLAKSLPENLVNDLGIIDDEKIIGNMKVTNPHLTNNYFSCLGLFLFYHQRLNHSFYRGSQENPSFIGKKSVNNPTMLHILSEFLQLLCLTANSHEDNKMKSSTLATLFLPLFFPESTGKLLASPIEGGFKTSQSKHHFMIAFLIYFWFDISSPNVLPTTFVTDLNRSNRKRSSTQSNEKVENKNQPTTIKGNHQTGGQDEDEGEEIKTCLRFATSGASSSNGNSKITETELELARLYAHVQASQDKKMIKKLNRAGVYIPSSSKKNKLVLANNPEAACKTPQKTPKPAKIATSIKKLFSTAKKSRNNSRQYSPSSPTDHLSNVSDAHSLTSDSFEVIKV